MRASTWVFAALPSATIAMTAPTPMMMPSIVRTVRILFRRRARKAILMTAKYRILVGEVHGFLLMVQFA